MGPILVTLVALAASNPGAAISQAGPTPVELVEQYERIGLSGGIELARQVASVQDPDLLKRLERQLQHTDRRLRADAALIFALRGEPRGFDVLQGILDDRSDRPRGWAFPFAKWSVARQIHSDRYYAVHVLAFVKDRRAAELLLPLLADPDVNHKAAWALGGVGDRQAIPALIERLGDEDALMRTSAIGALAQLEAAEALPRLRALLNDPALPRAGDQIPVSERAKAAIAVIERALRQRRSPQLDLEVLTEQRVCFRQAGVELQCAHRKQHACREGFPGRTESEIPTFQ
jgi:HEAT repeat protein